MGPILSDKLQLFPKKLSLFTGLLCAVLVAGVCALIAYMSHGFDVVHREQFPILERASINVRLVETIRLRMQLVLRTRDPVVISELALDLDSLGDNLSHLSAGLKEDGHHASLAAALGNAKVISNYARAIELIKGGHRDEVRTFTQSADFAHESEEFTNRLDDVAEALSQERDGEQARQRIYIRVLLTAFALISVWVTFLFARIYRTYQHNLESRLEAERQVIGLSRSREQLIHVLCHDLANPVGSITGFIEYVEKFEGDSRKKAIDMIRRSAAGAKAIIDSVRKMQALESGKLSLEIEEHALEGLVRESLSQLDERIRGKELKIDLSIAPELRARVEKVSFVGSVVNNLLTNAIKFSARGATIEIHGALTADGQVELAIRDHGVGMPEKLRERIFDESATTSRKGTDGEEGTGFGMPLVRRFVLAYGGAISVQSSEDAQDHGTEIRVELKAAA